MVRSLYILGSCAILAACGVFGLWLGERSRDDLWLEGTRNRPGCVELHKAESGETRVHRIEVPPLVAQAEAFSRFLDPPKPVESKPESVAQTTSLLPTIRPPVSSVRFRLCGTSCCPNQPGRSMALISEIGSQEGTERWVKEGAPVGHFVIHEIRQDGIVYRDGDQLREMAVETAHDPVSIVQDVRRGSGRSVATARDARAPLATPVEPNGAAAGEN